LAKKWLFCGRLPKTMPISVAEWDVDPEPLFGKGVIQWPPRTGILTSERSTEVATAQPDVYDDALELAGDLAIPSDTAMKLRFIGSRMATVAFASHKGRMYRGADAPGHRFALVHPDDVAKLLGSGEWVVEESKPARGRGRSGPGPQSIHDSKDAAQGWDRTRGRH
jgi:hypothetical protein